MTDQVRRLGLLSVIVVALAYASVLQEPGWSQLAHFSLVRSLSHRTPTVDRYQQQTGDLSWYRGHYYAAKAPGLAFLTVGPYTALERSGSFRTAGRAVGVSQERAALWTLGLLGCVLPTLVVLLLLRRLADDLEPGTGPAVAVTAGLGTLLFPFATVFFDHALSTALGFSAFALLWYRGERLSAVAVAGLLAGFAVTTDYPLALVAAGLGAYAVSRGDAVRRAGAYAAGFAVGALPLFVFNWWAFGSPLHFPYEHALIARGVSGHDVLGANDRGLFGVSTPSAEVAWRLLGGRNGLLTISPVLVMSIVALVPLYRRGRRREALLVGALAIAYVVYNSGYYQPFGGAAPGPRFLVPMLPFVALPLALAYRAWPWPTLSLAVPSIIMVTGITATNPTVSNAEHAAGWDWVHRVADTTFGGNGLGPVLTLLALAAGAAALAFIATPWPRPTRTDLIGACALPLGWVLLVLAKTHIPGAAGPAVLAFGLAAVLLGALAAELDYPSHRA